MESSTNTEKEKPMTTTDYLKSLTQDELIQLASRKLTRDYRAEVNTELKARGLK